jgi:ribonuclease G
MTKRIIVNVIPEETRMALSDDGRLLEVAVERAESDYMVGNIYKGRVENVLPGMQAAFINIGIGKNAFLYAGDIFPHKSFQRLVEEENLTVGADIMIEIVKDAMGTKGPRATTHFSIPGRYVVVMPSVDYVGVSRRIESGEERARLRALAEKIRPKGMGVIVRTVAEGHSEEELSRDFQYLSNLWGALTAKAKRAKPPFLLYRDADLIVRIIRDHVKDDIDEVVIDNAEAHARMVELAKFISPDLVKKIQLYKAKTEIFTHFALEEEWNRLADRRVDLKCGGYLIIDKTEALTVIDVNTGRFIGHSNLADTVFRTNMEAAAEIARQLRLRDIGGIIVADFIDMQKDNHKKAVLTELEACLKADNTKTNVLGLTELGLVEMTRKKARQTYEGTLYEGCPCCGGRGIIQSPDTLAITIRRQLRRLAAKRPGADLVVQLHPRIAEHFGDKKAVTALEKELGIDLTVESIEGMQPEVYAIFEGDKALIRSTELRKARKQSPRREQGELGEESGELEPLSEEELAPLLAEKFAMEAIAAEPASTLESRLAAMAGSLWEPLLDLDDDEDLTPNSIAAVGEDGSVEPESKKPRRRRRSKKMLPPSATEKLPEKSIEIEALPEPEIEVEAEAPVKKTRRRRKAKKPTVEVAEPISPLAEVVVELAEEAEPTLEVLADKPKRKRRRKKKPVKLPESIDSMEPADAQLEAVIAEEAPEDLVEASQDNVEQSVTPKAKRRRRRKKKPIAAPDALEETGEVLNISPQPAELGEIVEDIADAVEDSETTGEAPKKTKRRRRRKKPASKEIVADTAEVAEATDAAPVDEAGEVPAVKKKRRRRRSSPKKKDADSEADSEDGLENSD